MTDTTHTTRPASTSAATEATPATREAAPAAREGERRHALAVHYGLMSDRALAAAFQVIVEELRRRRMTRLVADTAHEIALEAMDAPALAGLADGLAAGLRNGDLA